MDLALREQLVWTFCDFATSSVAGRDAVLDAGVLQIVLPWIQPDLSNTRLLSACTALLPVLAGWNWADAVVPFAIMEAMLPAVGDLLLRFKGSDGTAGVADDTVQICGSLIKACSCVCEHPAENFECARRFAAREGVLPRLVELAGCEIDKASVSHLALRAIRLVVTHLEEWGCTKVLDAGALPMLRREAVRVIPSVPKDGKHPAAAAEAERLSIRQCDSVWVLANLLPFPAVALRAKEAGVLPVLLPMACLEPKDLKAIRASQGAAAVARKMKLRINAMYGLVYAAQCREREVILDLLQQPWPVLCVILRAAADRTVLALSEEAMTGLFRLLDEWDKELEEMQLHPSDRAGLAAGLPEACAASGAGAPGAMTFIEAWLRRMAAQQCNCDKPSSSSSDGTPVEHWPVPVISRALLTMHWGDYNADEDNERDACKYVFGDGNDSDASSVSEDDDDVPPLDEDEETETSKIDAARTGAK
jgi:hypothetical protein